MSSQSRFGTADGILPEQRAVAPDREQGRGVPRVVVDPEDAGMAAAGGDPRRLGGSAGASSRPRGSKGAGADAGSAPKNASRIKTGASMSRNSPRRCTPRLLDRSRRPDPPGHPPSSHRCGGSGTGGATCLANRRDAVKLGLQRPAASAGWAWLGDRGLSDESAIMEIPQIRPGRVSTVETRLAGGRLLLQLGPGQPGRSSS